MGDLNNWIKGDQIGDFTIQGKLGNGYEAVVYLVRDERDGHLRTLKLFKRSNILADVQHTYQHWLQYAGLSSVKQCLEWGVLQGQRRVSERPWILLEYTPGETLAGSIERGHIRDPTELVIQLLQALAPIHARGLGIGDLDKGRNVIVERKSGNCVRMVFIDMDAGSPAHRPPEIYEDLLEVLWLARKCCRGKLQGNLVKVLTELPDAAAALQVIKQPAINPVKRRTQ